MSHDSVEPLSRTLDGGSQGGEAPAVPVPERRAEQYRQLVLIRRFEERAAELFAEGKIVGTAHSCVGQEAIAVGAASAMRGTDFLVGHHRSHGHLIAAGADLRRNVFSSSRVGPAPERARSSARATASSTAATSLPSTTSPGMP